MRTTLLASNRKGFTLIDLLVATVITAVLAAVLSPVFAQGKGKVRSQQMGCLSNLKRIGRAQAVYCDDHDGYYQSGFRDQVTWDPDTSWVAVLEPWIRPRTKSESVWYCPSAAGKGDGWTPSYIANSWLYYDQGGYGSRTPVNRSMIRIPSRTAAVWDNSAAFYGCDYRYGSMIDGLYWFSSPNPDRDAKINDGRHNGSDNFLFADGHVASYDMAGVKARPGWRRIWTYPPGVPPRRAQCEWWTPYYYPDREPPL